MPHSKFGVSGGLVCGEVGDTIVERLVVCVVARTSMLNGVLSGEYKPELDYSGGKFDL